MPKTVDRIQFLSAVQDKYDDIQTITRQQVKSVCAEYALDYPNWLVNDIKRRVSRGVYRLFDQTTPAPKPVSVSTQYGCSCGSCT